MAVTFTPIERLEFGLRWESARAAYYLSYGRKTEVQQINTKIDQIQYDLNKMYCEP